MTSNYLTRKKIAHKLSGMSTLIIVIVVMLFFTITNAINGVKFISPSNLSVILNQACFLMIVGAGQAIVILTGGINLSMGAVMAFSTVLWGDLLLAGQSTATVLLGCFMVLLTGMIIGLINGILITKFNITPYIATFAMMYVCRGLAWVYLRNRVLYPLDESFRKIAMGRLFTVGKFTFTMPMAIAFLVLFLLFFILRKTNFGRYVYFSGSNNVASRFSGIKTDRIVIIVYMLSSLLAAFGGLMYVARMNACEPGLGTSTHFDAITVSLIGGFAMSGGYGNIWGVVGGSVVIYTIQSGMNSLQLPSEMQSLINGLIIIFSVYLNRKLEAKKMILSNELSD